MRPIKAYVKDNKESFVLLWKTRLRGLFLFTLTAFITGFGTWSVKSGFLFRFVETTRLEVAQLTMDAGFALSEVLVQGRFRTDPMDILQALKIERGMPIVSIDIDGARERLEKLPWVKKARVERHLPDILRTVIEEREPVALWQRHGKFKPVGSDGVAIQASIKGLNKLPIVVGEDAPLHAPSLLKALSKQADLTKRVRAAIWVGKRRWDIKLDDVENGLLIHLPEDNMENAWNRLAKLEAKHGILKRKLSMIDLRLPDRLIVRLDKDAAKSKNKNLTPNNGFYTMGRNT